MVRRYRCRARLAALVLLVLRVLLVLLVLRVLLVLLVLRVLLVILLVLLVLQALLVRLVLLLLLVESLSASTALDPEPRREGVPTGGTMWATRARAPS